MKDIEIHKLGNAAHTTTRSELPKHPVVFRFQQDLASQIARIGAVAACLSSVPQIAQRSRSKWVPLFCVSFSLNLLGFNGALTASSPTASLDDTIIVATRPEQTEPIAKSDTTRGRAIETLQHWARGGPAEEERIVAAIAASLKANDPRLRYAAASALGARGRKEFTAQLFASFETDPNLLNGFLFHQPERDANPPVDLLRSALRAKNQQSRSVATDMIGSLRVRDLRPDLQIVLESDQSEAVRSDAARALARMGSPESAESLERAVLRNPRNYGAIDALGVWGGDAQTSTLIALLNSANDGTRASALRALSAIKVTDPAPVCDALAEAVEHDSGDAAVSAILGILRYKDRRGLSLLRRAIEKNAVPWQVKFACVSLVQKLGGPDALAMLHEMLGAGYRSNFGIEKALAEIGDPASGPLVWAAYLQSPIRRNVSTWCATTGGYHAALPVLEACSTRELLAQISERADQTTEKSEKRALCALVDKIERRLSAEK